MNLPLTESLDVVPAMFTPGSVQSRSLSLILKFLSTVKVDNGIRGL